MRAASSDPNHYIQAHARVPAVGVLLANVGSPDAPTPQALRRYLGQFLWDPRVVAPPPPRWLWWLILHGIILRTRPAKSAQLYQNVWTPEGSPLLAISRRQRDAIAAALRERLDAPVRVALGMGYGNPSIAAALAELREAGCARILVFPLFPQYASATTASIFDGVAAAMRHAAWVPELRFIHGYYDEPGYIAALAGSIRAFQAQHGVPEKLIMSFHGVPRRYLLAGDPYHCFCLKTARLVAEALKLPDSAWLLTFQSRFGREPWLQPYTDETLRELARQGIRRVQIVSPAFSADCLETLEELAMTNRELFEAAAHAAGGEAPHYEYIPALNDAPEHIELLTGQIVLHMGGWGVLPGEYAADRAAQQAAQCQQLAREAILHGPNGPPRAV